MIYENMSSWRFPYQDGTQLGIFDDTENPLHFGGDFLCHCLLVCFLFVCRLTLWCLLLSERFYLHLYDVASDWVEDEMGGELRREEI